MLFPWIPSISFDFQPFQPLKIFYVCAWLCSTVLQGWSSWMCKKANTVFVPLFWISFLPSFLALLPVLFLYYRKKRFVCHRLQISYSPSLTTGRNQSPVISERKRNHNQRNPNIQAICFAVNEYTIYLIWCVLGNITNTQSSFYNCSKSNTELHPTPNVSCESVTFDEKLVVRRKSFSLELSMSIYNLNWVNDEHESYNFLQVLRNSNSQK